MNFEVITLDALIIVAWLSYVFVFQNECHDPGVKERFLGLLVVAIAMIIFVGFLTWYFQGVPMVPGPGASVV